MVLSVHHARCLPISLDSSSLSIFCCHDDAFYYRVGDETIADQPDLLLWVVQFMGEFVYAKIVLCGFIYVVL